LVVDSVIAGFVMKVDEVTAGPGPAAFDAVTEATYCVPGANPVRFAVVVVLVNVVEEPDTTGVTTTV